MTFFGLRNHPLWLRAGLLLGFVLPGHAAEESPARPDAPSSQPSTASAVTPGPDQAVWTLERSLARALEANPELLGAKHEFERQQGARMQVRAELLPSVGASASASRRQPGLVDLPPDPTTGLPPPTESAGVALAAYDVRLEFRQLIFDGLSSWYQLKRQELIGNQAYLTLRGTALRVIGQVQQGFDAILMRNTVALAEQRRVEEYQQLVTWTERKYAAGEIPEFELLRAEAELQGARAELAESVRLLREAEQSFRRTLQISDLVGPIKVEGEFRARDFDLPIEDAISRAKANRPDLAAAEIAVEAARRNQQSQTATYFPKVELFASYGARSSYYDSETLLRGWTVGAVGQWNLFDSGGQQGRKVTLRAERRSAETKLAELQHQVASRLHELYQSMEQTRVSMESQEKSLNLAARASHDARRLYDLGEASLEQVLQAEMTQRRAMSRMNEAVFNYNSLVSEIELSVGGGLSDSLAVPDTWKP